MIPPICFETLCWSEGQLLRLAYHEARFRHTLRLMGSTNSCPPLAEVLRPHLPAPTSTGRWRCRVDYTAQGVERVTVQPYTPRSIQRIRLLVDNALHYAQKSADRRALYAAFAQRGVADEVLLVRHGLLTDTTIANIALYSPTTQQWHTPVAPLLCGTHRAALLDAGLLLPDGALTVSRLSEFTQLCLFNAMLRWQEVVLPIDCIIS